MGHTANRELQRKILSTPQGDAEPKTECQKGQQAYHQYHQ